MSTVVTTTESVRPRSGACRLRLAAGAGLLLGLALLPSVGAISQTARPKPPPTLLGTGLYSDFDVLAVNESHLTFSPQYPLWSDGAAKRRWISLPPGTAIDASDPEAWVFPVGTRLWKEFSLNGQRIETRYMERRGDGQWLYGTYAWSPDGREAHLVSERGRRNAYPLEGGRSHTIPSVSDCKVCHQGGRTEVLGFSALQLSRDRDPGAVHGEARPQDGVDLQGLVDRGLLVGLPADFQEKPPRIASRSGTERAVLGYFHGNCGHCHNDQGSLKNLGLFLRQTAGTSTQAAVESTVGQKMTKPAPGQTPDAVMRIEPGQPERSALLQRVSSRNPALQMPPLGTELVDQDAVSLIRQWISRVEISSEDQMEGKGEER